MRDTRAQRIDRLDPLEVPIVVGDDDAVLAGGDGADALTGGAGRDVFVFAPDGSGAPAALDEAIADLAPGEDRIDLRAFQAWSRCRPPVVVTCVRFRAAQ